MTEQGKGSEEQWVLLPDCASIRLLVRGRTSRSPLLPRRLKRPCQLALRHPGSSGNDKCPNDPRVHRGVVLPRVWWDAGAVTVIRSLKWGQPAKESLHLSVSFHLCSCQLSSPRHESPGQERKNLYGHPLLPCAISSLLLPSSLGQEPWELTPKHTKAPTSMY